MYENIYIFNVRFVILTVNIFYTYLLPLHLPLPLPSYHALISHLLPPPDPQLHVKLQLRDYIIALSNVC